MTSPIEFGWEPIPVTPVFSMGQDWIVELVPKTGSPSPLYPNGTTITAYVYTPGTNTSQPVGTWSQLGAWAATFNGDTVIWKVQSALTDKIPHDALFRIMISYPNTPTNDNYVWAKGHVQRND